MRAGLVTRPADWPWSSWHDYTGSIRSTARNAERAIRRPRVATGRRTNTNLKSQERKRRIMPPDQKEVHQAGSAGRVRQTAPDSALPLLPPTHQPVARSRHSHPHRKARGPSPLRGRGWCAAGAFTSRSAPGEGPPPARNLVPALTRPSPAAVMLSTAKHPGIASSRADPRLSGPPSLLVIASQRAAETLPSGAELAAERGVGLPCPVRAP